MNTIHAKTFLVEIANNKIGSIENKHGNISLPRRYPEKQIPGYDYSVPTKNGHKGAYLIYLIIDIDEICLVHNF